MLNIIMHQSKRRKKINSKQPMNVFQEFQNYYREHIKKDIYIYMEYNKEREKKRFRWLVESINRGK